MDKKMDILIYFQNNIENMDKIEIDDLKDLAGVSWDVLQSETSLSNKAIAFEILAYISINNKLDLCERWTMYWALFSKKSLLDSVVDFSDILDLAYTSIYEEIKKHIPDSLMEPIDEVDSDTIVILTGKFNSKESKITKRIMDCALELQKNFNKKIYIINDNSTHFKPLEYMDVLDFSEYNEGNNGFSEIIYSDRKLYYYQNGNVMPDLQAISNLVYNLRNMKPGIILFSGFCSITFDICSSFLSSCRLNSIMLDENMNGYLKDILDEAGIEYIEKECYVDESKFFDIVADRKVDRSQLEICKQIENRVHNIQAYSLDNMWATVFNSTVVGSEWLEDTSLSPGRAAIGYPGLYALYRVLDEFRPKNLLEMGLGQSTKIIGAYAEHFDANHTVVEHNQSWINFFLNKHGNKPSTKMVCLEVKHELYSGRRVNTSTPINYYLNFKEKFGDKKFDFIFIDGPNGSSEFSRVDITEILPECLADEFVIMLDDSERNGEKRTNEVICEILHDAGIVAYTTEVEGLKNTRLIVSENQSYLCTI